MTSIFDRWTDLDPALALRRIEAAYGSAIFDRDSYTDPARALRQIETAFDIELDDVNGLLDPSTLEDAIDTAIEADSSPDWVPADAKIFIDLIAPGRAWTEDDGEVTIDTLLGTDANTVNYWGPTGYNAADLGADGLVYNTAPPAFIGAALSKVLSGATLRYQFKQQSINFYSASLALTTADGSGAVQVDAYGAARNSARINMSVTGGTPVLLQHAINHGTGVSNALAVTVTSTRFEVAANGISPVTDSDTHPGSIAVALLDVGSTALQSITIYDALPSTAGLSALSETGVTNTAPTGIAAAEWDFPQSGEFTGTMSRADVGDALQSTGQIGGIHLAGSDPEGNPLVLTIQSFVCANPALTMILGGGLVVFIYNPTGGDQDITIGDYVATIRATDPGGLYVEQEFTITVTA